MSKGHISTHTDSNGAQTPILIRHRRLTYISEPMSSTCSSRSELSISSIGSAAIVLPHILVVLFLSVVLGILIFPILTTHHIRDLIGLPFLEKNTGNKDIERK